MHARIITLPPCRADGQRRRVQIAMGLLKPFQVGASWPAGILASKLCAV